MNKIINYTDLIVWQKAHSLALKVYKTTRSFPHEEKYGLVQQIRRSASSVATNIVEGFGRFSKKEYVNFLYISRGSLSETEYHLRLSQDLGYVEENAYREPINLSAEIGRMLNGLIAALKRSSS